jgi:4-alpha-glucanotransferase
VYPDSVLLAQEPAPGQRPEAPHPALLARGRAAGLLVWQGFDITDRLEQGLLDATEAHREQQVRHTLNRALQQYLHGHGLLAEASGDLPAVLNACLAFLSRSPAQVVLVNLEDLWLETQPQNFPGTREERPNWQRKVRHSLEAIYHMPQVLAALRTVHHLRKQPRRAPVR